MDMDTLAALWAEEPEFADDASNDYRTRAGYTVERIARRNRTRGTLAECSHCGDIVDAATDGTAHVVECERKHRTYRFADSRR